MKVEGATAIVTGGAQGLGKAFTEALLKEGAKVCFVDINEKVGRETESELLKKYNEYSISFVKCDISKESDFKAVFAKTIDKFGRIDILVNNAGILDERDPTRTIEINLLGAMKGTSLAFEHMRMDKGGEGGLIINVASIAGLFPAFFMPAYAASKHGLVGYTRSLADNPLTKTAYHVNFACICPAFTDTNMLTGALKDEDTHLVTYKENKLAVLAVVNSLGVNTVDAVAEALIELARKEDNNGSVVTVDSINGVKYRYEDHSHRM